MEQGTGQPRRLRDAAIWVAGNCSGTFRCGAYGPPVLCEQLSGTQVQRMSSMVGASRRVQQRGQPLRPAAVCDCHQSDGWNEREWNERDLEPTASVEGASAMTGSEASASAAAATRRAHSARMAAVKAAATAAEAEAAARVASVQAVMAAAELDRTIAGLNVPSLLSWSVNHNTRCSGPRVRNWAGFNGESLDSGYSSLHLKNASICRAICASHPECKGFYQRLKDGVCSFWRGGNLGSLPFPGYHCHRKKEANNETVELCSEQGRRILAARTITLGEDAPPVATDMVMALRDSLLGAYSQKLYRGISRIPPAHSLKIVYLRLLDNATLLSRVQRVCQCNSALENVDPFYKTHSWSHNIADAVWMHGDDSAIGNHQWAEVTHCPDEAEHGAWFYVASGSGISINVGKTLVIDYRTNRSAQLLHAHADHMKMRGHFDPSYDSVQFLHRKHSFSRELKHELVMLRWKSEADFAQHRHELPCVSPVTTCAGPNKYAPLTLSLAIRSCGRDPYLYSCTENSLPVVLQKQCSRNFVEDRLRHMFPLADLGRSTPKCRAPGPLCVGVRALESNATWGDLIRGSSFRAFQREMHTHELQCPFDSLEETLSHARSTSCPARCGGHSTCCKLKGHANKLTRLTGKDAARFNARTVILRTTKLTRASEETDKLVQAAFLAKVMGNIGVGPKVHAQWLSTNTSQVSVVMEELTPLTMILNQTQQSLKGVQDSLLRHFDTVARLGIILLDAHAGNVLVSQRADGDYDTRLTDFDMKFVLQAEYLTLPCRKLIMVALFSLVLSCGRKPRQAFSNVILEYDQATARRDRCSGSTKDLLGKIQITHKKEGEWSALSAQLKAHVMSLMKRRDLIPDNSPCREQGNYSLAQFGLLRTLRRLPRLNLTAL